jgi:TetR/AcrR family transcriptional regulator, copper-responsive repressor
LLLVPRTVKEVVEHLVAEGMAQQARDGADRAALELVADLALKAWPWVSD